MSAAKAVAALRAVGRRMLDVLRLMSGLLEILVRGGMRDGVRRKTANR
jgi:hypothetical protein